jgi:hypothetical protein
MTYPRSLLLCMALWGMLISGNSQAQDRVELQGTAIIGNRELPKVLYIVPWKKPNADNLMGNPVGNLLRDALAIVDRDVFLREVEYYKRIRGENDTTAIPKK